MDVIYANTFLLKSVDKAWYMFETLSKNSMHQVAFMLLGGISSHTTNRGRTYELGHFVDMQVKLMNCLGC